jgi:phosphate transport system permease protein
MWLLGRTTLLVGDSLGRLHGWFGVQKEGAGTPDHLVFVGAKDLPGAGRAVTVLSPSPRNRLVAVAYEGGEIRLFNVTNERLLNSARSSAGDRIDHISIAPKEDGILVRSGPRIGYWRLDPRHPETSFAGLFGKVWYEGYPEPDHVWQSAGGTDDFERKLGLVPLIFGTLKATLYSMMLGVPIALLAALFTSEFLHPRMRVLVKSVIEMMAGLPSVVLGFLAALVIAPIAQNVVPATLSLLFTMPFSILLGAYLWQFLPQSLSLRLAGWQKLLAIGLTLPLAVGMALLLGPVVERTFFEGRIFEWLDGKGRLGDGSGGWMLLFLPLSILFVVILQTQFVNPAIRKMSSGWSRSRCAAADFAKFLLSTGTALLVAWTASKLLAAGGLDPRGSFVGTFNQRNSLVVGFVMGFAIIPIIYTLAEDALSSVPDHLRQGSLGAGATPWQTAFRIVVPTAMSGLFSAVMVGLGRAVGETMIVVMATGNTPVREWNIFSGFRTLSANIAVEMPEAPKNSTHYRTLFLAALALFAFTFVLNTLAEVVRQRFRKKAFQL